MRGLPVCALGLLAPLLAANASEPISIPVGVMSPVDESAQRIGQAHDANIQAAVGDREISVQGRRFRIDLIFQVDSRKPGECAQNAARLVQQGAVIILGPVRSDCTLEVRDAGLDVPILTTLSTATALTENNTEWLFRMAPTDRERLIALADFAKEQLAGSGMRPGGPITSLVIYDGSSSFGMGLRKDLRPHLNENPRFVIEKNWGEVQENPDDPYSPVRASFLNELPDGSFDVYVLGSSRPAVEIARSLARLGRSATPRRSFRFYLFGSDPSLLRQAPSGTISVGDTTLDLGEIPGDEGRLLRQRFGPTAKTQFLLATYESMRFVLRYALVATLTQHPDGLRDPVSFRERLRNALATREVPSLQPNRRTKFTSLGELEEESRLPTPIYEVTKQLKRRNPEPPVAYLEISAPESVAYLETPVTVNVAARGKLEGSEITIESLHAGDLTPVASASVRVREGEIASFTFYPRTPGRYVFRARGIPSLLTAPELRVTWGWAYFVAAGFATLSAIGAASFRKEALRLRSVVEGVAVALILTWFTVYLRLVPGASILPIPSFGGQPLTSGVVSGILGGWFGLHVVAQLLALLPWRMPRRDASSDDAQPAHIEERKAKAS